jgi:hypothetical protein
MIVLLSLDQKRIRSDKLHSRLEEMYRKVDEPRSSYCHVPCPQIRPVKACVAIDAILHERALEVIAEEDTKLLTHEGRTRPSITPEQLSKVAE